MRNSFLLASFVFAVSLSLFAGYEALGSFTGTTTLTIKGTLPADMVEMLRNQEAGLELYKEKDTLTTPTTLQKGKNDYSFSEKKGRNISFKTKNGKFKWDEDPKDYLSFQVGESRVGIDSVSIKCSGTWKNMADSYFDWPFALFDTTPDYTGKALAGLGPYLDVKGKNLKFTSNGSGDKFKITINSKGAVNLQYKLSEYFVKPVVVREIN